ncbi:MAG: glycosyltransferase family 4 protein [Ktedonobacterales bacterium]
MRVAIVTENFLPKLDGVTRTLAMLLEHLQHQGHAALVLGPEGAPRRYAGARIIAARGVPLPLYPELRLLFPAPALERRLARFRPDIVHVVDPMVLGAAGIVWGQHLGVPVVASYHTNLAAYCSHFHLGALAAPLWAYRRLLHNQCAVTLSPSPSTARELQQQGFSHVEVWSRGVDTKLFSPERRSLAWRTRITGDATTPIVLYTGRLSHEKNLTTLVSAFTSLHHKRAHLVLVGDGPARADLEHALAGHPATFLGYLQGEALAEAYASADVFAFPSLTETFGQVVHEAMASGLPVVAFDAEGVRDQILPGKTGLLAPANDTAAFTRLLDDLLTRPERRRALGLQACEATSSHTWHAVMNDLLTVYERLVASGARARAA